MALLKDKTKFSIDIWPKQQQFLAADDIDELLFGGAVGGGKSEALLHFMLKRRMEHPRSVGIAFRRKYPDLEKSLIPRSYKFFGKVGAKYNSSKHFWKFPNGSVQFFGFLENDSSVYDHHSAEYDDECFDELTMFTEFQYKYLISRNRSSIPGVKPLIRSASNPGNIGHVWVKKRFIDPAKVSSKWWNEEEQKNMGFIPSRLEDNPSLSVNDPGYEDRLRVLGDKKFKSLRYGDWEIFEGQFFDEWDSRPGMTVLEYDRVPDTYSRKFISMDWGYSDPSAIYWWEVTPMGRIFIYRELYVTRLAPKELAQAIEDNSPESEKYECLWSPPELWGKEVELEGGGTPIQKLMQTTFDAHRGRIQMKRANNARIPGWQKCREWLKLAPDGKPWLQISPCCKNLIRTVPAMIHDEKKVEDMDSSGEDHASDSFRYGAISLSTIPKTILSPQGVMSLDRIYLRGSEQEQLTSSIPIKGKGGYGW